MVRVKGELEGRSSNRTGWKSERNLGQGTGCDLSQYRYGQESPQCRNHPLSGVSFLSDSRQVRALGSPGRKGRGMQVGATDLRCGFRRQEERLPLWEDLGEAPKRNRGDARRSKEVRLYQSAEPTAPGQVRDGNSRSRSQGSSWRNEGGPAKSMMVSWKLRARACVQAPSSSRYYTQHTRQAQEPPPHPGSRGRATSWDTPWMTAYAAYANDNSHVSRYVPQSHCHLGERKLSIQQLLYLWSPSFRHVTIQELQHSVAEYT